MAVKPQQVTDAELAVLRGHQWRVTNVAFSPDGKRIVSNSRDHISRQNKAVHVWDVASGQSLQVIRGDGDLTAIATRPTS